MKNLSRVQLSNQRRMLIVLFIWFYFFPFLVQAANPLDVVINEIAWMGTKVEGIESKNWWRYEWLELYNNTVNSIYLDGWKIELYRTELDWTLELKGVIPSQGYFLIVASEKISSNYDLNYSNLGGKFKNSGQKVLLKDNSGNIIDNLDCFSYKEWFAGDKSTKQTMERKNSQITGNNPENWISSQNPGGTPKAKNSISEKQINQPKPKSLPSEEKSKPITYPSGIIINEILPSPEGPDEKNEWIEIFNKNDFEINLSDWQISDTEGTTKNYTFPKGIIITPKGFLVLSRATTTIALNNGGDGLNLIQPDGKIIDSVSYENSPRNHSYNRTDSKWVWSPILTPGSENIIPASVNEGGSSQRKIKKVSLEKETEKTLLKKELAVISKPFQETKFRQIPKLLSAFLIALTIAIFSGIIILILKRNLKKFDLSKKLE